MSRELKPGDRVQDIRNRSKRGVVTDGPAMRNGRLKLRIQWDDGDSAWLSPGILAAASEDQTLEGLLRDRAFGGHDDFVRNYTHRKLLNPVDDTLYTLSASRTKLLAHQFKPLLKFLDSVHRRYLIADEVGLGKTIEAGIIIAELRARKALGGVLILCPNHLRTKWKAELFNRFDEDFEVIQARKDWLTRMARLEEDGTDGMRLIVGHKTVGAKKLFEAAEQGVPAFDLIIVDEAHYARNTATYFRRLLGELADAANQLLLLTATPLQTRIENLLSLMRLVDEDAFRNRDLFELRMEVNRGLVRAEKALRRTKVDQRSLRASSKRAREALGEIGYWDRSLFGLAEDDGIPGVEQALERLSQADSLTFSQLAETADSIRELNLLSGYVTRTRKIDVADGCQRRVRSLRPALTEEEQAFYGSVVQWMRKSVEERHGREKVGFLTREPERRLASSLHGFWQRAQRGVSFGDDSVFSRPPRSLEKAYAAMAGVDTKYDQLLKTLRALEHEDPSAKVLVFASFRATIRYVTERLAADGVVHEVIHGGIPMDPSDPDRDVRGQRVKRFLHDESCRVLVSSNVGGEGLDLQRASVVINYDLPWNPAVVEQRIGRVDRFGQDRAVIHVVNFLLPDTVEDLVFTRLIERLSLFEDTVGDLAQVLGPIVRRLSEEFLAQDLTPDQAQERLRDAESRSRNRIEGHKALLAREGEFIAFDEDFSDKLRDMERTGQTIRPDEVAKVCQGVIQRHFKGSYLRLIEEHDDDAPGGTPGGDSFQLYVDFRLREMLKVYHGQEPSSVLLRFFAKVPEATPRRVTFAGEVAEHDQDAILLTTRHPFVRALVAHAERAERLHAVASLRVSAKEHAGMRGLLVVSEAELKFGTQVRRYLLPFLVTEGGTCVDLQTSRRVLRAALDGGSTDRGDGAPQGDVMTMLLRLGVGAAEEYLGALSERLYDLERRRVGPRVAEANARYDRRIANAQQRLGEAERDPEVEPNRTKRLRQYLARVRREKKQAVEALERLPDPEETFRPVGATWIEVK